jgi:hypothetical protein
VEWTQTPGLPSAALFGVAPHEGGDAPQPSAAAGAGSSSGGAGGAAAAAAAAAGGVGGAPVVVKKTVVQLPSHPQMSIGGHQMPVAGRIGGAKGVGSSENAAAGGAADGQKVGDVSVVAVSRLSRCLVTVSGTALRALLILCTPCSTPALDMHSASGRIQQQQQQAGPQAKSPWTRRRPRRSRGGRQLGGGWRSAQRQRLG